MKKMTDNEIMDEFPVTKIGRYWYDDMYLDYAYYLDDYELGITPVYMSDGVYIYPDGATYDEEYPDDSFDDDAHGPMTKKKVLEYIKTFEDVI